MRLTEEELNEIKKKYGVNRIWSYSRINKFKTSLYEYFLNYVKHIDSDRTDSIYVYTGNCGHEILDKLYENEIEYKDMINEFENGWTIFKDISNLKFDRTDESKDSSIAEKYKFDLQHFFTHHNMYKYKVSIEIPVVINVNSNIFIGYIDADFVDDEKCLNLIDFKTSSIFTGKNLEEHSTQLLLYAYGMYQTYNVPLDKIKCGFNFLKYCTIQYMQANGAVKSRNVERYKIGESLQANLKVWIKKLGYQDRMDELLKEVLDTNGIECLPQDLQDKYYITDCHVYIDVNKDSINKIIDDISLTIKDIEVREKDYEETKSDACFWDSDESLKAQSYYLSNLCSYSPNLHKPYKAFLDKLESVKNSGVFNDVGSDVTVQSTELNKDTNEDIDLSWLDEL